MVLLIGLSLIPVAVDWSLGQEGAPGTTGERGLLALAVAATALTLHRRGRGFIRSIAALCAILGGYAAALALGWVDLAPVAAAPWFAWPRPFYFMPTFDLAATLPFVVVYLVTAMETVGQVFAVGEVAGVRIEGRHLRGGVLADGVASGVVGCLNSLPTNAYSQNIGLIALSGVTSRGVVLWAGAGLAALGLVPKLGAVVAQMPSPVLGGAGLVMFGMVAAAGVKVLSAVSWGERELLIAGVALSAGVAAIARPEALEALPAAIRLFLGSGIAAGGVAVFALNAVSRDRSDQSRHSKPQSSGPEAESTRR